MAADLRGRLERWMATTSDPLLDVPVPAPAGALLNAQDQVSASKPTHRHPAGDATARVTLTES